LICSLFDSRVNNGKKMKTGIPKNVDMCSERLSLISTLSKTWVSPELHQSIAMIALRRGQVVFSEAVGNQTPEPDSPPARLDAIYTIASLSKVITATAVMTLVEDGLLSLHNPVADYIPEFVGESKDKVTLWHLLTHTIGGYRMEDVDDLPSRGSDKFQDSQSTPDRLHPLIDGFLKLGYEVPLTRGPGTVVGYSNYGYELLGEVVRRVSGQELEHYAEERIFKPLGMKDTHYILPREKWHRLVRRPVNAPFATALDFFMSGLETELILETPWASCGVCSTAHDLAMFALMFLNGGRVDANQVLSPTTVSYMKRNQTPGFPDWDGNEQAQDGTRGIGWDIPGAKRDLKYANLYSPSAFSHSGAGGILVWVDPEYDLVGVFMSVELKVRSDLQRCWAGDRYANAVTAAITEI
jgi:CubicO group peptidase (beta-lactamase class C family)